MLTPTTLAFAILALGFLCVIVPLAAIAYQRFGGIRVVACPATGAPAAIEVDWVEAAITSAFAEPKLRIERCSLWPRGGNCAKACLAAVRRDPRKSRPQKIVERWCSNRVCTFCGKSFGAARWRSKPPALLASDGRTREWRDIPPADLYAVLASDDPICWNCHVAGSF